MENKTARLQRVRPGRKGRTLRNPVTPYMFLLPFLGMLGLFMLYPIIYSIVISFMRFRAGEFTFFGLSNYKFLIQDQAFHKAILNTIRILLIQVPIQTFMAVVLATFMNDIRVKLRGLWRMFIFMPVLIDTVSYALVFGLLFNQREGFINSLLRINVQWFNEAIPATALIIMAVTWRWTGYNAIIILAGLQNIGNDLYEAASIDGCNRVKQFIHITLPGAKPVILFSVIFSINGVLQLFTEPNLLTRGGPAGATETIVSYLYQIGFTQFNFGLASAGAYVLAIMIAVVTGLQFRLQKEE